MPPPDTLTGDLFSLAAATAAAQHRANARDRERRRGQNPRAARVSPAGVETIQERFDRFDRDHPEVYAEFRRLALILLRKHEAGQIKWVSAKHIFEKMRADYYFAPHSNDVEPFRLSNDFTSRYARKLLAEDARFAGVLRLRELETP